MIYLIGSAVRAAQWKREYPACRAMVITHPSQLKGAIRGSEAVWLGGLNRGLEGLLALQIENYDLKVSGQ